jgi:hypothetical protein
MLFGDSEEKNMITKVGQVMDLIKPNSKAKKVA